MFFLGYFALAANHSMDATITNVNNIISITLSNQVCDNLYVTKNISSLASPLDKNWNYDTYFNAAFKGNLQAGNINYLVSSISSVRAKLREVGTYDWITVGEVPITKAEDLSFDYYTYCARGGKTEYEGALVPVINGAEGNLNINTVCSDFEGIFICENKKAFGTKFNVVVTPTRNKPSSVLNPLRGKYPITIYNTEQNYESGTVQALFIAQDDNCNLLKDTAYLYREELKDFLLNGKQKLFKHWKGRNRLVSIIDNIPEDVSQQQAEDFTLLTFSYVEIGDSNSAQDLYDNDIIDVFSELN